MRTIAIGDVHGCSLALETILAKIEPQTDDRLIFMGDYVDRGPNSRRVVEILLELPFRCQVIPLRGNHEAMVLAGRDAGDPDPFWLQCGGQETLLSYGGALQDIPEEHWQFFASCRMYFETDTHLFFHANYDPTKHPRHQPEALTLWQHLSFLVPARHVSGKKVIVGHTPQRNGEILDLGHLLCIDTGCFAGGWLTALDVLTGQCWQANNLGELR